MEYNFKGSTGNWKISLHQPNEDGTPNKNGVDIMQEAPTGERSGWLTSVLGEHIGIPYDEMMGNAHLMAAAPDLLTALITVYRTAKVCGLLETLGEEEREYMKQAIHKALNIQS